MADTDNQVEQLEQLIALYEETFSAILNSCERTENVSLFGLFKPDARQLAKTIREYISTARQGAHGMKQIHKQLNKLKCRPHEGKGDS